MRIVILILGFNLILRDGNAQEDREVDHSVGVELLGNGGLFSLVYNRTVAAAGRYRFQLRPQFAFMPGSTSDEIPYSCVPIFGFNNQLVYNRLRINSNVSAGIDFSLGPGHYPITWIAAIEVGPKYLFDFIEVGIHYVYFIKEPLYSAMPNYPHALGISIEVPINKSSER